jgi:hypothetical protein
MIGDRIGPFRAGSRSRRQGVAIPARWDRDPRERATRSSREGNAILINGHRVDDVWPSRRPRAGNASFRDDVAWAADGRSRVHDRASHRPRDRFERVTRRLSWGDELPSRRPRGGLVWAACSRAHPATGHRGGHTRASRGCHVGKVDLMQQGSEQDVLAGRWPAIYLTEVIREDRNPHSSGSRRPRVRNALPFREPRDPPS